MKNLTKTLTMLAVGLLSCGLFCQQAQAITGDIEFTGAAKASRASGAGTTTITFKNPGWKFFAGTGGYSAVTFGTATTFSNFRFTGDGTGATLTGPVNPQWSFVFGGKTYTFELLALTSGHVQSGSMAFTGTGTAFINGGGPSPANWSLQGSTGKGFTFTLSSSTTGAVSAPDGGSAVALLGIAFAGIEGVRRSIRARKHNRENGENGEKGASKNVIHRRHRNPTEYGKYKTCCYFAVNLLKPFSQNMSGNHSTLNVGSATRKKQFKSNLSVLVPCLVFFLQSNALAIPITGEIDFGGGVKFNTGSLATASRVNKWKSALVGSDTGDFAAFAAPGSAVAMSTPWVFASSSPFSGLWSVGGFTFDLTSCAVISRSQSFLDLAGSGTISGDGFDATPGDWSVTFTKHRGKRSFLFSFEADPAVVTPTPPGVHVPESGSTGALFGLALTGLFYLQLRKVRQRKHGSLS